MRGGLTIVCVCVGACVRHHACLRMRAREPTAGMLWRMQTRAYVDVGAGVGVSVGEGVGVDVGAGVGVSVGAGVGLHAKTAWFYVAAQHAPTIPPVAAPIGLSPGADVDQWRRSPSVVPALM